MLNLFRIFLKFANFVPRKIHVSFKWVRYLILCQKPYYVVGYLVFWFDWWKVKTKNGILRTINRGTFRKISNKISWKISNVVYLGFLASTQGCKSAERWPLSLHKGERLSLKHYTVANFVFCICFCLLICICICILYYVFVSVLVFWSLHINTKVRHLVSLHCCKSYFEESSFSSISLLESFPGLRPRLLWYFFFWKYASIMFC